MIEVYKAKGELEAQIIKGMLDSYDIPCILRSNAASSVHSFVFDGMGEVRVMVPESFAEEASTIINSEYQPDSPSRQEEE
ncbi:MAG: DUF2007 domain-containing protein [Dehalococcoidales bacterium]|jgi:hypothetical protein|nr:DUF2007 domain-containing protein [Dehalococcoidales bacterium]MDD3994247.1 DUF2007 domain-containing protein [Dehalococcoidales bacterium]NLT27497.1 DUF2007 domain-containing protein [Dehalococcoidales bacterium]